MSDETFNRLAENAFDFLGKSLDQLEREPKHSVINFYSAVELILKARLLREHWTLTLAKEKSRKAFESGDFQSVSFEVACTRLDEIVGSPLPDKARSAFDAIRKHRNRIVHFHHVIQGGDPRTVAAIATEQLRAWHWLNELLTVQWSADFGDFREAIAGISERLSLHRTYVQLAFDNLRSELEQLASNGTSIHDCPFCELATAVEREIEADLRHIECRICGTYWNDFYVECEECGHEGVHTGGVSYDCPTCTHVMYGDDISRSEPLTPCDQCNRQASVIRDGETRFCMGCLEIV